MVKFNEEKQEKQLLELHEKEAEDLAQVLSQKYGISYSDFSIIPINTDALRLVPEEDAREASVAAFKLTGKILHIGVLSPQKEKTRSVLKALEKEGYKLTLYLVSQKSLERAWERYKEISYAQKSQEGVLDIVSEQVIRYTKELNTVGDIKKATLAVLAGKQRYHISGLVELFIAGALATEASDLHVEPEENEIRLRLRLDGVLNDVTVFERKIYKLLLSRIKILSGLKLNIKDEAQDGRFSINLPDTEIEIRTSIIPGAYGESIVMRVLNPITISIPLEELGIEERLFKLLEHEIHRPNGMILNTGPTGSGKTTTLYTFLKRVQTPGVKIITIEDPIEYHLPGITQTQVEKDEGYTFASGLRSSLRQDPDVIMVGEIRDNETAKTAIHAALTGHLVLSTLHTNSAAGAIPRLIDLEVNSKIIGSAVNVSIAQRLLRRLCKHCKRKGAPREEEKRIIEAIVKTLPLKEKPDTSQIWRPGKCTECNNIGYKGRIGIFEAILMDEAIEKLTTENPSEREIKQTAARQGILDMRQDGIVKVLRGITSLEELGRVIDLEEV